MIFGLIINDGGWMCVFMHMSP